MTDQVNNCCCAVVEPIQVENAPLKPKRKWPNIKLLPIVEMVCRIALGVFAAICCLKVFAIAGGAGVLLGIGFAVYKNIRKEPLEVGLGRPSCGVGFFDYLSGVRYPAIVSAVITAVFVGIHMHCSPMYIAFCMVPLGMFVGTQLTQIIWNLSYREIHAIPLKQLSDVWTAPPGMYKA